ncbi:hypothetical protein D3C71_1772300 [compost metagenome]
MRDSVYHRIHQLAALGQERLAGKPPVQGVAQFVFIQQSNHAGFDHLVGQFRAKAEVELHEKIARNNVVAAGARLNVGDLHAGRREEFIAFIPLDPHQLAQHWRRAMYRVISEMRVGHVALHAVDGQVAGQ